MDKLVARLLTVDRGNTTFDCLDHATGRRERFPAQRDSASLVDFVGRCAPTVCVAATVVQDGLVPLESAAASLGARVLRAGRDLPCPLALDYSTPETLGADRWLGAFAAHRRFGRSVVVDCGSATTVNLVELDGTFRGGPIAPGLAAFVAGLATVTPALKSPDLDALPVMPPRSSQAAIDAGVLLGYCGLVERLVADMLSAAAGPCQVIVTGGNAERLLRHSRLRARHVDDLVHQGLFALGWQSMAGATQ